MRFGEINNHTVRVFSVVEQRVQVIGRGQEQLSGDRVVGHSVVAVSGDLAGELREA